MTFVGRRRRPRPALVAAVAALAAVAVGLTLAVPAGSTELTVVRIVDIDLGDGLRITANVEDGWTDQVIFQHRDNGQPMTFSSYVDACTRNDHECELETRSILEDARWSMSQAEGICPPVDHPTGRALLVDYPDGWVTATVVKAVTFGGAFSIAWNYSVNELGQLDVRAVTAGVFFGGGLFLDALYNRYVYDPGRFGPVERAIVAGFGNAMFHIGQVARQRWENGLCPDFTGLNAARHALPLVQEIEMSVLNGNPDGG